MCTGLDEEAPVPGIETDNNINVPDARITLCDQHANSLMSLNPLQDDRNEGISLYIEALELVAHYITHPCCANGEE